MNVMVLGAGIVGACTAIELLKTGARVTLIEAGAPGGEQAASHGNGAWLSPASIVPMSTPGLWKKVPGYLMDKRGPLTIRLSSLPGLAPWLWRFTRAGSTLSKVEQTASSLNRLLRDAPSRHVALAREAGLEHLISRNGLLYAYPDKAAFEAEGLAWRLRRINGVRWQEWDQATIREKVPQLAGKYRFGAWVEDGAHCLNPGDYVRGLVEYAIAKGANFISGTVSHIDVSGRLTVDGRVLSADQVVIACGIGSGKLCKMLGDDIPMRSERGYNIVIKDPGFELPIPVMPSDGRMANTSTNAGLRLSGQVELADEAAAPDWRRSDILLQHAATTYSDIVDTVFDPTRMTRWMGKRPSVADGLPVISKSRASPRIFYAFGHGHIGLASAPKTAQLLVALMMDKADSAGCADYAVERFY
ncbi:NAD(P)/FAD-dependent oxidoreductase [Pseudomonas chlororaphis]|uniref:NAD(P)/FAD-dependent oxidoreductase n=1 Tax=Pseudomonas chlororaphis TaxID=587753 RepID=UPI002365367F|nr:FAD-dependent oxidoreductase [Pseudomonas chlororaphis]WDH22897.1 FAD-dependent oxidoreductase [Pseudomonas chlororaphis]